MSWLIIETLFTNTDFAKSFEVFSLSGNVNADLNVKLIHPCRISLVVLGIAHFVEGLTFNDPSVGGIIDGGNFT